MAYVLLLSDYIDKSVRLTWNKCYLRLFVRIVVLFSQAKIDC